MELTCTAAGFVNTAFHQNAVPIVQEIRIDNEGGEALTDVILRLSSEPPVVAPLLIPIERVEAGAIRYIRTPDLRLDAALLRNLTEGVKADLLVTADAGGSELARHEGTIQLPSSARTIPRWTLCFTRRRASLPRRGSRLLSMAMPVASVHGCGSLRALSGPPLSTSA